MRRLTAFAAVPAATLAATLLVGCGDGSVTTRSSATPSATASAAASPSRDPQAQAICDDLRRNILDTDAKAFGTELGKMVAARGSGNRADEARAQKAASAKLDEIAGRLRRHAGEATDPQLKTALTTSADNLAKLAADTGALSSLNSLESVSQATRKFATALSAITDYCSA
jgi:hypothetical protein